MLSDISVLKESQDAAKELFENDSKLVKPENANIKKVLYEKFGEQLNNITT